MVEILLGFMAAAFLFLVLMNIYVGWRYVYCPWKVMRKDIKALFDEFQKVQKDFKDLAALVSPSRNIALSDPEIAALEARMRAKISK